jgi:hypothetical protein
MNNYMEFLEKKALILLMVVLIGLAMVACGGSSDSTSDAEPAKTTLQVIKIADVVNVYNSTMAPILREWEDAKTLAGSTSRISLAPVISQLQSIERRVESMDVPLSIKAAHLVLIDSMNDTIQGYLYFMAQDDDSIVSLALQMGKTKYSLYQLNLTEISRGFPVTTWDALMKQVQATP